MLAQREWERWKNNNLNPKLSMLGEGFFFIQIYCQQWLSVFITIQIVCPCMNKQIHLIEGNNLTPFVVSVVAKHVHQSNPAFCTSASAHFTPWTSNLYNSSTSSTNFPSDFINPNGVIIRSGWTGSHLLLLFFFFPPAVATALPSSTAFSHLTAHKLTSLLWLLKTGTDTSAKQEDWHWWTLVLKLIWLDHNPSTKHI